MKSIEKGRQFNVFHVQLEFEGDVDSENLSHTLKLLGVEPADACIIITRDRPLTGLSCTYCLVCLFDLACFFLSSFSSFI